MQNFYERWCYLRTQNHSNPYFLRSGFAAGAVWTTDRFVLLQKIRTAPAICPTGITVQIKEAWRTQCCRHPGTLPSRSSSTSARMRTREASSEHHLWNWYQSWSGTREASSEHHLWNWYQSWSGTREASSEHHLWNWYQSWSGNSERLPETFYCSITSTLTFVAFIVFIL